MSGTADANLVLAAINPGDALHLRAMRHLDAHRSLAVPFSVGLELLLIAKKHGLSHVELLAAAEERFTLENADVLYTAAEALDAKEVGTVFDAVHLADAFHRGEKLHTADAALLKSAFPTEPF